MTVPTGSPAWARASTLQSYGGDLNKVDYGNIGVVSPKTDVSADHLRRIIADLSAVSRAAPLCKIVFVCHEAAHPTVAFVSGMFGVYTGAGYAGGSPPAGFPSVTRSALGQYVVTLSASYSDAFGVSYATNVNAALASVNTSAESALANPVIVSARFVYVYTFVTATSAATGEKTVTLVLY